MKKVVLLVLDGFGTSNSKEGNPIAAAQPKNLNYFKENYPYTTIGASGEFVGLPKNEAGNSEVGHINIGAGRIVLQDLVRVNNSIENKTFFDNPTLKKTIEHSNTKNGNIHILGLVGQGNVHSSLNHLYALLEFYKKNNCKNVFLHLFTDGRDSPPTSGVNTIKNIEVKINEIGVGKIASIIGRYFAMDRDNRWERTQKAYECMTVGSNISESAVKTIQKSYDKNITDEFIEPSSILDLENKINIIKDNDAVVFFNFRIDRPRQLAKSFIQDTYKKPLNNLYFVTMTQYEEGLPFDVIFPTIKNNVNIGNLISENNLKQLRLTESEKERFVTFYINGQNEITYKNEDRKIIPSAKVATYDKKPEMSANEITDYLLQQIKTNHYDFILVNFANADMVGHTGNFEACKIAVNTLDECIERIAKHCLDNNYCLLITADHGNIEQKINPETKEISTEHTSNPVPFYAISKELKNKKINIQSGKLADVGTTVLKLLDIDLPKEMTGKNLLE
jgi:2,3-bisphosphoglycerate-independent phosphoglycerate mutase